MFRTMLKRLAVGTVVGMLAMSLMAKQSEAGWHWWGCGLHHYSSCHVSVHYAPIIYHSWCYPHTYCYPYHGCHWGCYSPCYSSCYHWPSCGHLGYSYAYGGAGVYQKPMDGIVVPREEADAAEPPAEPEMPELSNPTPAPGPAESEDAAPSPPAETGQQTGSVTLAVNVPEDAKVYVNGLLTKTPGTHRQYISRGLLAGYQYTYRLRAVVNRDGREVSDTRVVRMHAGDDHEVSFDFGIASVASR